MNDILRSVFPERALAFRHENKIMGEMRDTFCCSRRSARIEHVADIVAVTGQGGKGG